jgi:hypothetical protein
MDFWKKKKSMASSILIVLFRVVRDR